MEPLKLVSAAFALNFATPCEASSVGNWQPYIAEASFRFGVPVAWIECVMSAESNGQTMLNGQPIRSHAGAIGLMQLMPSTWKMLRRALALGANPDDPHDNILAGALYLRMMYDRFGYPAMFAAYDAGPTRLAAHLATGRTLPRETAKYLRKLANVPMNGAAASATRPRETLFVPQSRTALPAKATAPSQSQFALFAVRNDNP